ncbi:LacI family DNA-binding transcriptional regulator [Naasia sp. SYSU D00057]|uniref:LacI family DNA-binding transcriptional regulator n=1 Tax=Naasia sp. SYSU D00057 TaxID=2817380 RepID=UPI001B3037EB|nr:LacI family DNA-binding transcriptional regulator [Naasia sp. SYSU D00057]
MTPTLRDVAQLAGVAFSTASDALAGKGRVAPETRERVLSAAKQLGYRPNLSARNLRLARTGAIGLYLPRRSSTRSYYVDLTFGVVDAAQRAGAAVTLLTEDQILEGSSPLVDGTVVVDPAEGDPVLEALLDSSAPVVCVDPGESVLARSAGGAGTDNVAALAALTATVLQGGARRPVLLAPPLDSGWSAGSRRGYEFTCAESGVPARVAEIPFTPDVADIAAVSRELLDDRDAVDAVIALPEGAVIGVLTAALAAGRRVGDDLMLASGVDNLDTRTATPAITALDLHAREIGIDCAELLLARVRDPGDGEPELRIVPFELRVRESTGGPR